METKEASIHKSSETRNKRTFTGTVAWRGVAGRSEVVVMVTEKLLLVVVVMVVEGTRKMVAVGLV